MSPNCARCSACARKPPADLASAGWRLARAGATDFKSAKCLHGVVTNLTFLGRPTIGFGARTAHQHRSLTVAQPVSLEEGFDGLLVVDDGVCACPVSAPQAAVETPGIEHAGERIPDVRKRIRFPRQ